MPFPEVYARAISRCSRTQLRDTLIASASELQLVGSDSLMEMTRSECCESYKSCGTLCEVCPRRQENAAALESTLQAMERPRLGRRLGFTPVAIWGAQPCQATAPPQLDPAPAVHP